MTTAEPLIEEAPQCFEGMRVLEVANGAAGAFCGRLLATLGADVVKVEPPRTGDRTRSWGPYVDDRPERELSLLFLDLNLNKRGITLDIHQPSGRDLLHRLVAQVDIMILQGEEPRFSDDELAELRRSNPQLILAVMRPFGLDGPYRDFRAEGLNLFQAGGSGYLMPAGLSNILKPEGQPLNLAGHTSEEYTGLVAGIAIAGAWYARPEVGGQLIDCSQQEAHLSIGRQQATWYANDGVFESRETHHTAFGGCVPCVDGYVQIYVMTDGQWVTLKDMLDHPAWMDGEELLTGEGRAEQAHEIHEHLVEWAAGRRKMEIHSKAQRAGCPVAFYASPAEVCASPHEHAREFFVSADHEAAGRLPYTVSNFKLSSTPPRINRTAPILGQHNGEVYGTMLGLSPAQMTLLARLGAI